MPFTNLFLLHGYNYAVLRITFEAKVVSLYLLRVMLVNFSYNIVSTALFTCLRM
jgi:hypothetical protein